MEKHAIGIDLGGTNLKGIVMNHRGESRNLTRIPTEARKGGERIMHNIVELVGELIRKEGGKDHICGVGIGTPGFVDADGTMIGGAENLPGWKGTNIYEPIRAEHGLNTVATNDATVAALAESRYGAGRDVANLVLLTLGTGIGGGIVIDNKVYLGSHGMAGELGHITVQTDGLQCNCGLKGCVEQYGSATGIVRNAKIICESVPDDVASSFVKEVKRAPGELTSKTVYDYVGREDPFALKVNEHVCTMLARGIGVILNCLAPDRIILAGGVMKAGEVITQTVARHVPAYCWHAIAERCTIVSAQLGEDAGVTGAAALVFQELEKNGA